MIFPLISSILLGIGIILILGLSPEQVTQDLMQLLEPKDTLRERSISVRGNRQRHFLYRKLRTLHNALVITGKGRQFSFVCAAALVGIAIGVAVSILINNLFLLPVLVFAFALAPFLYINRTLGQYEKNTRLELESALANITSSYIRSENILEAVKENLPVIKPPLSTIFQSFVTEASYITSNMKQALSHLQEKIDDEIFQEWCDTLIRCQDDRTLKDSLQPTINKLKDIRLINNELKTIAAGALSEYKTMVALLVGNIPLMYVLNKDWIHTLLFTTPGKITVGICAAILLVTAILAIRYTRPIKYKR